MLSVTCRIHFIARLELSKARHWAVSRKPPIGTIHFLSNSNHYLLGIFRLIVRNPYFPPCFRHFSHFRQALSDRANAQHFLSGGGKRMRVHPNFNVLIAEF
jgi:hypothetical protein